MSRSLTIVLMVSLLASGCSFIQSWGDYRSDDGTDGGVDGGDDAGDTCEYCNADGCGFGSPECILDPSDGCFYCNFDGLPEGAECDESFECSGDLVCDVGLCLYPCADRADCDANSSIGSECVTATAHDVCVDHECDPVYDECAGRCFFRLPNDSPDEVGSICAFPEGTEVGDGQLCGPGTGVHCGAGLLCRPAGMGETRCGRLCYPGDDNCSGTEICMLITPPLRFESADLGVCTQDGSTCDLTDPTTCPVGEICAEDMGGTPRCMPDLGCTPGDSGSCIPGQRCSMNAAGDFRCGPGCSTVADCPSTVTLCMAGYCIDRCTSDADCASRGFNRCSPPWSGAGVSSCVSDCSLGTACRDGSLCADLDGDGQPECLP